MSGDEIKRHNYHGSITLRDGTVLSKNYTSKADYLLNLAPSKERIATFGINTVDQTPKESPKPTFSPEAGAAARVYLSAPPQFDLVRAEEKLEAILKQAGEETYATRLQYAKNGIDVLATGNLEAHTGNGLQLAGLPGLLKQISRYAKKADLPDASIIESLVSTITEALVQSRLYEHCAQTAEMGNSKLR